MRMKPGMNNNVYYLDTNICIFHMRRPFGILADRINAIEPERIKIPAVVKGELLVGAEKSKRRNETLTETLAFLMPYEIVPFEDSMLMTYAKIRASIELILMSLQSISRSSPCEEDNDSCFQVRSGLRTL